VGVSVTDVLCSQVTVSAWVATVSAVVIRHIGYMLVEVMVM
jgi:hypothetical protein